MVRSFIKLARMAAMYSLYSEASLRSDMAKRIMYSILPGIASPTQTMATQGVVDTNALKSAVEGRKDIIKYGVNACMKELRHYEGGLEAKDMGVETPVAFKRGKAYYLARALADQGDNENALAIAVKLFGDEDAWPPSYGGEAWLRIAKTLKDIVVLDKNLEQIRASRSTDPEAWQKEIIVMQQLIVAMNIFDGLSHNTASILSNMVEEEALAMDTPSDTETKSVKDLYRNTEEEFQALQRMMDAKELRNPVQVFREIEPTLVGSGDINRYKDWVSTLHRDPTYRAEDPNLEDEKFLIRFRKQILPFRSEINNRRDFMRKGIEKILTAGPQSFMALYRNIEPKIDEFANLVERIISLIDDEYFIARETANFPISNKVRYGIVEKLREGLKKISMDARLKIEMARNKLAPIVTKYQSQKQRGTITPQIIHEFQTSVYEVMKSIFEGYGSLTFYLDTI